MDLILSSWTFVSTLYFVAFGLSNGEASLKSSRGLWRDGPCSYNEFRCANDRCLSKYQFCNGLNECGDDSDEQHCSVTSCSSILSSYRCHHYYNDRCIPLTWVCDGHQDCRRESDEEGCGTENSVNLLRIFRAKRLALKWIIEGRNNERLSNKWGVTVARRAIALYLGDQEGFLGNKTLMSEMAYEVSLNVLSKVIQNSLKGVSSTELATHLNALLVTCVDVRNFYGLNLVSELRERADASNETHPSVTLALCNAGDVIDYNDVAKTVNVFRIAQRNHRTDIEALAVLALSCAAAKDQSLLEGVNMTELTSELKKNQFENGTVESSKTTTLVMQALYASERDYGEDDFDEVKALLQILKSQMPDGYFGNTANTYYALPVLAYKSLVNVSSSHCAPRINDIAFTGRIADENVSLQYLLNLAGRKSRVKFSLWIGNNKTLERTVTLRVPSNTSFYGVMEWAARVDPQFRFEYSMRGTKPYIYSISGVQDDPENSLFWLLYTIGTSGDDKPTLIMKSPADVFPTNGQHLVFWYKSG